MRTKMDVKSMLSVRCMPSRYSNKKSCSAKRKRRIVGVTFSTSSSLTVPTERPVLKPETNIIEQELAEIETLSAQLNVETLSRRYYDFDLPGSILHIAHTRQRGGKGGKGSRTDLESSFQLWKQADYNVKMTDAQHFDKLISSIQKASGMTKEDAKYEEEDVDLMVRDGLGIYKDVRLTINIPKHLILTTHTKHSDKDVMVPLTIRYQQYSRFSTYTFNMPCLVSDGDVRMKYTEALSNSLREGECLHELLQNLDVVHDDDSETRVSWLESINGDIFLKAVIGGASSFRATSDGRLHLDYDVGEVHRILNDRMNEMGEGNNVQQCCPSNLHPIGCTIGEEERLSLFLTYGLSPKTEILHIGAIINTANNTDESALREVSRNVSRFLELETYRLLCLLVMPKAKALIDEIDVISSAALAVLEEKQPNIIGSSSSSEDAASRLQNQIQRWLNVSNSKLKQKELFKLIKLQTRCEQLGVEVRGDFAASEAYGNVVERRLQGMQINSVAGTKSLPNFIRKRLDPALRTYSIASKRLNETTEAITRTASLCRTEVDIDIQSLNEKLIVLGSIISFSSLAISLLTFLENFHIIEMFRET